MQGLRDFTKSYGKTPTRLVKRGSVDHLNMRLSYQYMVHMLIKDKTVSVKL